MLRKYFIVLAAALFLAACSPPQQESLVQTSKGMFDEVKAELRLDVIEEALSSERPKELEGEGYQVRFTGKAESKEVRSITPPRIVDEGNEKPEEESAEPNFASQSFAVFNPNTGYEYEVTAEEGLNQTVAKLFEEFAIPLSSSKADEEQEYSKGIRGQAITDGVDTRVKLSNPSSFSTWRRIVHLSNGCTGTLVGPRLVITAAHCLADQNGNSYYSFSVAPARAGSSKPYGSYYVGPGVSGTFLWVPSQWRAGGECANYTMNCRRYDYGYVVLGSAVGNTTGWMGVKPTSVWTLETKAMFNRGYAGCGYANSPSGCQPQFLYGDANTCDIGDYRYLTKSWYQILHHSCDTNKGHSGSSVYFYLNGHPTVAMVHHSWNSSKPSNAHLRNVGRRVAPDIENAVKFLNSVF